MWKSRHVKQFKTLLFYGIMFLLAALTFVIVRPFLVPLTWAAVMAILCDLWTAPLKARLGPTRAAAIGTAGVTIVIIVPALLLMVFFVLEGIQAARGLQDAIAAGRFEWVNHAWNWIARRIGDTGSDLPTMARESAGRVGTFLAGRLGSVLRNIVEFLFDLFVMLFALFYFIRDGSSIMRGLRNALPLDGETLDQVFAETRLLIHDSVRISLVIALVQGSLGGAAFALIGIGSPVFWGTAMAFLALLPVIGTAPVWIPAVVWLYATGNILRGTILLAICAGLVGTVDNILRPMMLSGTARLNGLLVFVSILGGVAAFGMLGIILGPVVIAMARSALDVYIRSEATAEAAPGLSRQASRQP